MNHTQNYALSQWERTDKVLMDDFNADNAKIDAAIAQKTHIAVGRYEIDAGTIGQPFHIVTGFRPKAVLIWKNFVTPHGKSTCIYSALFLDGYPIAVDGARVIAQVEDDGFVVQRQMYGDDVYQPEIAIMGDYLYIAFS